MMSASRSRSLIASLFRIVSRPLGTLVVAGVALAVVGCAGTPSPVPVASASAAGPPEWVISTPPGDARNEYFVASATDPVGDVAAAEAVAINNLIEQIVRFIGVTVTTETSAEARATLDEFEASVTQTVRQEGAARVSGFRVQDRFVDQRGNSVTTYLLVAYDRQALMAEKARIEALFRERQEAVARPEREARLAEQAGDPFTAIARYVEAAAAASRSDIDNADIRFENNMNAARAVVNRLQLERLNDNLTAVISEPFAEAFLVRVTDGGRPVAGVALLAGYRELMPNGRVGVRTARVTTGADGIARFAHPVPTIVGTENLTVSLDTGGLLQPLDGVSRAQRPAVDALREALIGRRVTFRYEVISTARTIPTGVVVLDTDTVGNPTTTAVTGPALVSALSQAGFAVSTLPFDPTRLSGAPDRDLLDEWRELFGARVERVIFGVVGIDQFDESDGVIVRVSGTVQAVDLQSGRVLHSISTFQRSRSSSAGTAINAAFRALGTRMGEDFALQLR